MNIGRTQWGVGGAGNVKHTHAHTYSFPRDTQGGWSLGQGSDAILTHVSVAPPLIKFMSYEHREDAVRGWGSRQWQTLIHSRTHTHRLNRDTQDRWSPGQGLDGILTHGVVALPLIKLIGYEHREDAVGGWWSTQWQTHTHTHSVPRDNRGG